MNLSIVPSPDLFRPAYRAAPMLQTQRQRRVHARLARPTQGDDRGLATDRLFLALVPPADVAQRIGDLARRLKIGHALSGRPLEAGHFHVTLCHLGDGIGLDPDRVAMAAGRAAGVTMPAFRVSFDRVMSFRNGAFVLCGEDGTIGAEVLQQRLSDALDGSPRPARPFTPHVTLLRDHHIVPGHDIQPVSWEVRDVVLVHSLLGKRTHRHLARLPLG